MSELIREGVNLMMMGMGTVFVFLTLLVIGTSIMSRIIMHMPGSSEPEGASASNGRAAREDLAEVAAVAAAVKKYHHK